MSVEVGMTDTQKAAAAAFLLFGFAAAVLLAILIRLVRFGL